MNTISKIMSGFAAVSLAGCGLMGEDIKVEQRRKIADKMFAQNNFKIVGELTSHVRAGAFSDCYTLESIPDNGRRYSGCVGNSRAFGYSDGVGIIDLKGLDPK